MAQSYGQYLLNNILPEGFKVLQRMTKSDLQKHLAPLAKHNPKEYVEVISNLKRLGDEIATLEGVTVGLDDIDPDRKKRDPIVTKALADIQKTKDPDKKRDIVAKATEELGALTKTHPGQMRLIAESGGRGSLNQLMKIVASPGGAMGNDQKLQPWLITRGYGEGLSPADFFVANQESRANVVQGRTAVSDPGEVSNILVNVTNSQVVTEKDCGTHNGLMFKTNDPEIMDRYLARDFHEFKKNELITPAVFNKLAEKEGQLMVRSPMTCEAKDGMCQLCVGLDEMGRPHQIGTNTGIRSAQAMSEPLTQFVLSSKHGVKRATSPIQGFKGLKQVLTMPSNFINKATLASIHGSVKKIEEAPQGGYFVTVENKQHYIPPKLKLLVEKGSQVEAGDRLSEGMPHPVELVQHKGLGAGRKLLVDSIIDIYNNQDVSLDRRHVEALAKAQIGHVRVMNDHAKHNIYAGDIVDYNSFSRLMRENAEEHSVDATNGMVLGSNYAHYTAGTPITPAVIKELQAFDIHKVLAHETPPRFESVVKPLTRNPLLNPDWLARLGYRHIKQSLQEAAHFGEHTNLHSTHPIPAFSYGMEFGEGKDGRY